MEERIIQRKIAYKPLPSQLRFHNCNSRFKVFIGPVGSGKSAALVNEVLRAAVLNPGIDGLLASPSYRLLEDSTKAALLDLLDSNNIPFQHRKADNTIILTDFGTKILCRTMEEPERLRAVNLAFFAVDELSYCRAASFLRLIGRLRHPKAKFLTGFAACTPNGKDFVYDMFVGENRIPGYAAIRATPRENYHLAAGYYDALAASYDEKLHAQEVLGEFVNQAGGAAYHAFDQNRNVNSALRYDPNCRLCWSLDFNVNPMCSVIGQLRNTVLRDGTIVQTLEILDEIKLSDAYVDAACAAFSERIKGWIVPGRELDVNVYGDPAGNARTHAGKSDWNLVWEYFARHPLVKLHSNVKSSHSLVRDRVNAMNAALYNAVGETRLRIHPQCKYLIRDLDRVVWMTDSNGNTFGELDKRNPDLTHLADAASYMSETIFPLAKRLYTRWS